MSLMRRLEKDQNDEPQKPSKGESPKKEIEEAKSTTRFLQFALAAARYSRLFWAFLL